MSVIQNLVPSFARSGARRNGSAAQSQPTGVKPLYDVRENEDAWGLQVYLPGVSKQGLEVSAEQGLITIRGRRDWKAPAEWTPLYRESVDAPFELQLEHDNTIDVDRIHAELNDGVLRISLPKTEAVKPRKIAIT